MEKKKTTKRATAAAVSGAAHGSPLVLRAIVYALRTDAWGARYKPDSDAVLRLSSLGIVRASRYGRLRLTCSRDAALRALDEANALHELPPPKA